MCNMITTDTTYRGIEILHYNYEGETEFYYISGGWWNEDESTDHACSAIYKAVKDKHPNNSIVDDSESGCMFFNFDNPNDALQAIDVLIAIGRHVEVDDEWADEEAALGTMLPVDDEPRNPYRGQPLYLEKCVVWDEAFAAGRAAEQAESDAHWNDLISKLHIALGVPCEGLSADELIELVKELVKSEDDVIWCVELERQIEHLRDEIARLNQARMLGI
jgi:hypothetical protein